MASSDSGPVTAHRPHWPALDGLRGLAVLMVIAFHTMHWDAPIRGAGRLVFGLAAGGWMGVDVFFVLSGFLITTLLLRSRGTARYYRDFVIRRALRILPLFVVTLLLLVWLVAAVRQEQAWWWSQLSNVRIAQTGFAQTHPTVKHFWSLAVEEQFYLFWPVVVALGTRRAVRRVAIGMVLLAPALRAGWLLAGGGVDAAYVLTVMRCDGLALGALLSLSLETPEGRARARALTPLLIGVGAALLAAVVALGHSLQWGQPWMASIGFSAIAGMAAGLVSLCVLSPAGRTASALAWAPLRHVGRYSYALYILHYPLIYALEAGGISPRAFPASPAWSSLTWFAGVLLLTYALSRVSWVVLERPCMRLRLPGASATEAAPVPSITGPLPVRGA